ncbi:copper homeostasis protein CutC [Muricauda sp. CAU 1633]|uniref:copper homeostasis protein CutC n=1 Tax=Allomuricauda sp. CAU 1633 TaxID=2816036 RepID=UPI001A8D3F85|nr:copper homeostasis protein CutC [Muricauda sp. CAU 1633]MBO0322920.1 copper homeostasis protein CutC [Muricauda sp. CAU 1633]
MLVEVCANSLESALNAQRAGADRIELCSELGVGGITPSAGLIKLVKQRLDIPVHVLIRPRSGHFHYSIAEFEVMKADIEACKNLGVDGIVSGMLHNDFTIDVEGTRELVELSKPMHFTFHRAFDWVAEPTRAINKLGNLGVDTILTSGGHPSAEKGIETLKEWQKQASISIMAGGGINLSNARDFKVAGLGAIHLSGVTFGNPVDVSGKISMNSAKHLVENQVGITNTLLIQSVVQAVK